MEARTPSVAKNRLIVVAGMLIAFGPLSIDMYLPAFPLMRAEFQASAGAIQMSLAAFFVGMAVGQLVYGPLSDRYGRRPPLLVGIAIYCLASLSVVVVPDVESLVAARLLQALGACSGMVIARAIIADAFSGREAARAFSLVMLVMGFAPVAAPTIGERVLVIADWRSIFLLLAAFGALCFALVLWWLPETPPVDGRVPVTPSFVARAFGTLIRDRRFVAHGLTSGMLFSCVYAYIAGSPFVFITLHGLTPAEYGLMFATNAFGLILASQMNAWLLGRFPPIRLLRGGASIILIAAVALMVAAAGRVDEAAWLMAPLFVVVAVVGAAGPNATALAMGAAGRHAGSASALLGVAQFAMAAAVGGLIGLFENGTAIPMAAGILVLALSVQLVRIFLPIRAESTPREFIEHNVDD